MPGLVAKGHCVQCGHQEQKHHMSSYAGCEPLHADPGLDGMAASELIEAARVGSVSALRHLDKTSGGHLSVNCHCPQDGSTPLYVAACSGNLRACGWLLHYGARADLPTLKSGSLPLHGAAARGHVECVSLLVRSNPGTVNWRTEINEDTALHLAAYRGHMEVCRVLISHGAAADILNSQGLTPVDEARVTSRYDVFQLLLTAQFPCYPPRRCHTDSVSRVTVTPEPDGRQITIHDKRCHQNTTTEPVIHSTDTTKSTTTSIDSILNSARRPANNCHRCSAHSNRWQGESPVSEEGPNHNQTSLEKSLYEQGETTPAQSFDCTPSLYPLSSSSSSLPLSSSSSSSLSSPLFQTNFTSQNDTSQSKSRSDTDILQIVDLRMKDLEKYLAALHATQKLKDQRIGDLERRNAALSRMLRKPKPTTTSVEFFHAEISPATYYTEKPLDNDVLVARSYRAREIQSV